MIAYAVLAHDDPLALRRLVGRLDGAPVVAHIDARVDLSDYESAAQLRRVPGFEYVQDRVPVNWGGYTVVEATLHALAMGVRSTSAQDSLVLLSGRCYPVRPISAFTAHLTQAEWSVHARAYPVDALGGWHSRRVTRRHAFDRAASLGRPGTLRRRAARKTLATWSNLTSAPIRTTLRVVAGSQWMVLPRPCAEEAIEALSQPEYEIFRDSFAPDEMALQTFIHNSRWRKRTEFGTEVPVSGKISELPNFHILDAAMNGTVERARALNPKAREYFIRKVDSTRNVDLLDEIDLRCQREAETA